MPDHAEGELAFDDAVVEVSWNRRHRLRGTSDPGCQQIIADLDARGLFT